MENDILKHRKAVQENILKSFGSEVSEDILEKAHQDGDVHKNGKWVWRSSANNGKGDWRVANPKKGQGSTSKKNESVDNIVDDINNGKKINDIYRNWCKIKTPEQHKKWQKEVRQTKFGTYGNMTVGQIIDRFNPKFKNIVIKIDFLKEVEEAYNNG